MEYGTMQVRVPVVDKLKTEDVVATPALIVFEKVIGCVDSDPRLSQMPQMISQPEYSHMWLGTGMPESNEGTTCLLHDGEPDSTPIDLVKDDESFGIYL
jgi:hypothetical protein